MYPGSLIVPIYQLLEGTYASKISQLAKIADNRDYTVDLTIIVNKWFWGPASPGKSSP